MNNRNIPNVTYGKNMARSQAWEQVSRGAVTEVPRDKEREAEHGSVAAASWRAAATMLGDGSLQLFLPSFFWVSQDSELQESAHKGPSLVSRPVPSFLKVEGRRVSFGLLYETGRQSLLPKTTHVPWGRSSCRLDWLVLLMRANCWIFRKFISQLLKTVIN